MPKMHALPTAPLRSDSLRDSNGALVTVGYFPTANAKHLTTDRNGALYLLGVFTMGMKYKMMLQLGKSSILTK